MLRWKRESNVIDKYVNNRIIWYCLQSIAYTVYKVDYTCLYPVIYAVKRLSHGIFFDMNGDGSR